MAPFLINHPVLIDHWMRVRETAIAQVAAIREATDADRALVMRLLNRQRNEFKCGEALMRRKVTPLQN